MNNSNDAILSHIKERLESLNCPYTKDGNDEWLSQLLLHPSEVRIQLLSWLVTLFDVNLNEILESSVLSGSVHVDTRYKKLLIALNIIGVCKIDDLEIVRGTASQKKQLLFWDNFLDIVYISQNGSLYPIDDTNFALSHNSTPMKSFKTSCIFVDTLVRENNMKDLFSTELHLFAPDMEAEIKAKSVSQELPTLEFLVETSERMQADIDSLITDIHALDKKFTVSEIEQTQVENYCRKFDLSLKMLSQVMDSYIHVHSNEIDTWCNRPVPKQSEVGPQVKSVDNSFQNLLKFSNDLMMFHKTTNLLNDLKKDIARTRNLLMRPEYTAKLREVSNVLHQSLIRKQQDIK